MSKLSAMLCPPEEVLITSWIAPERIASTQCGRPSNTLFTTVTGSPASRIAAAVPRVAVTANPISASRRASDTAAGLSPSRTLMKAVPDRQAHAGAELAFGEGALERGVDPHHLARRFHFGAEQNIDIGEPREGEHALLDGHVAAHRLVIEPELGQARPGHHAGSDLRHRHARRLGHERNGARGARIDLEHMDRSVLDRILHVHQPDHLQRLGERLGLSAKLGHKCGGKRVGGSEQALSPEWMPASSMCSITPAT